MATEDEVTLDSEALRESVWRNMANLNKKELGKVCEGLELNVNVETSKRSLLYSAVVKHLMEKDEGEDGDGSQGYRDGLFKMVDDTISKLKTLNLKVEDDGGGNSSNQTGLLTTERQNTENEITPLTETSTSNKTMVEWRFINFKSSR